jgi:hypothetical protein
MGSKNRNDFRVFEERTSKGSTAWRIRVGGSKGTLITSLNTIEEANEMAKQLNIDPWYAERGQTRKDRADAAKMEKHKLH